MAKLTLSELTTPLTRQEVEASIYQVLANLSVPTTSWKPGAVVRTMIVGVSAVFAAFTELMSSIAASGFLELSEGEWLTLVAWYVYGVERLPATSATGELLVSNSSGNIYLLDPGDLIVRNTTTGATFRNTQAITISAGVSNLSVTVLADVAGSLSNSAAASLTELVVPLLGVTCSNPTAMYGQDEEKDPALRIRCAEKLGALSPMGPWDAYNYAIRNATIDGRNLGITQIAVVPDGYGNVTCYVAKPGGTVTDEELDAANDAVQRLAAPQAVTAIVVRATGVPIAVTYEVYAYQTGGLLEADVVNVVQAALDTFIQSQPVGGHVTTPPNGLIYFDGIRAAIHDAMPEIFHVVLTLPAADIALTPSDVATLGVVTPTVAFFPTPQGYTP